MPWSSGACRPPPVDKPVEKVENSPCDMRGRDVLAVFAKEPVAGKVKTRLCPPLTFEQAASLYHAFHTETVASVQKGPFIPVLFYAGRKDYFQQHLPSISLISQGDGDLGARLDRAFRSLFDAGCRRAIVIGTDTPDLPFSIIDEAFAALGNHDAVLSPAKDGGYVLIGQRSHHPDLFRDIPWSTAEVLRSTRTKAAAANICLAEVAGWEDVDDLPSLKRFIERAPESPPSRLGQSLLDGNSGI